MPQTVDETEAFAGSTIQSWVKTTSSAVNGSSSDHLIPSATCKRRLQVFREHPILNGRHFGDQIGMSVPSGKYCNSGSSTSACHVVFRPGGDVRAEHGRRLPLDQLEFAAFAAGPSIHTHRRRAGGALSGDTPADVRAHRWRERFGTQHERDDRHSGAQRQSTQRELAPVDLTGTERLMKCRQWSLRGYFPSSRERSSLAHGTHAVTAGWSY